MFSISHLLSLSLSLSLCCRSVRMMRRRRGSSSHYLIYSLWCRLVRMMRRRRGSSSHYLIYSLWCRSVKTMRRRRVRRGVSGVTSWTSSSPASPSLSVSPLCTGTGINNKTNNKDRPTKHSLPLSKLTNLSSERKVG